MNDQRHSEEEAAALQETLQYLRLYRQTSDDLKQELRNENESLIQSIKQLDPSFSHVEEDVRRLRVKLLL